MATPADIWDTLSDPAWVVVMVTIIGIAVTVFLYLRGRAREGMTYAISSTELVSVRGEARGKVKITYEDRLVGPLHAVEIRIANSGNAPVLAQDFEHALIVHLGENATPLTFDVGERHPSDLAPRVDSDGYRLLVAPLLLNGGDHFTVTALVSDFESPGRVEARVAGIPELTDARSDSGGRQFVLSMAMSRGAEWASGLVAAAAIAAGLTVALGFLFASDEKTSTRLTLRDGSRICGRVLRVGTDQIVVQSKGSGKVRVVRVFDVATIKDNVC